MTHKSQHEAAVGNGDHHHPHACHANGCPLIGTHSSSTNGEGPWLCWMHASVRMHLYDTVTLRIRQNAWMLRFHERVSSLDDFDWAKARDMAAEYCRSKGRADLAPESNERLHAYKTRFREACYEAIRPPVEPKKVEAKPKASDGRLTDFLTGLAEAA